MWYSRFNWKRNFFNAIGNRLESIKENVSNEEIICYFAQDRVENLLKEEKRLKVIFQEMNIENEIIDNINTLIYETKQFLSDIVDMIDIEKNQYVWEELWTI